MINFNKVLTSKIISLIVAVSFFMADISYAGAYQQDSLRVPMRGDAYKRAREVMEERGKVPPSATVVLPQRGILENDLIVYLRQQRNHEADIAKVEQFIKGGKPVIIEVGCGNTKGALALAAQNQDSVVIAIDNFDLNNKTQSPIYLIYLNKIYVAYAEDFERGRLPGQRTGLDNLVVLRADDAIFSLLPDGLLSHVVMVNTDAESIKRILDDPQQLIWQRLNVNGVIVVKAVSASIDISKWGFVDTGSMQYLGVDFGNRTIVDFLNNEHFYIRKRSLGNASPVQFIRGMHKAVQDSI